jgi:hypothetical protein
MVLYVIIQVIFIQTGFDIAQRVIEQNLSGPGDDSLFDDIKKQILETVFPVLLVVSVLTSSGLYVVTPVKDRQDKLRYLLNFAGISSPAYYIGLYFADFILYLFPCILILILSFILQIDTFTNNAWEIILSLFMFGLSYIPLCYVSGFLFSNSDNAFKYNIVVMLAYAGIFTMM